MTGHGWMAGWSLLVATAGVALSAGTARADDWPMFNHDPHRSSATADQVDPPYRVLWIRDFYSPSKTLMVQKQARPAPYDEGEKLTEQIASGVQAIVAGNTLYLGTLSNRLYALDAATGRTRWRARLGEGPGGILHSPAVADGLVFVGSLDGHLYAVETDTGIVRWTFASGRGGFWNSPLPLGGRVYAGSRDGRLYALSAETGKPVWSVLTGGPILNSPSADGGRIYVTGEDRRVYCVEAKSGKTVWTSKPLPGRSARWYSPVIDSAAGVCFVTTSPAEIADYLYGAGDGLANVHADGSPLTVSLRRDKAWKAPPKLDAPYDAQKYQAEQQAIVAFLRANPEHRGTHVLDLANGKEKLVAPLLYRVGCGGVPTPPAIGPDGEAYVLNRSYYSNLDLDSYCVFGGIGRLDVSMGAVELLNQTPDSPRPLWGNGIDLICDESAAITVGGGRLYIAHADNTGTMLLPSRRTENIYGYRDIPGGVNPRRTPFTGTVTRGGDLMQASITEWHGPGRGALSISDDRIYWITCGIVVAIQGTRAGQPAPPAPRLAVPPAAVETTPASAPAEEAHAPNIVQPEEAELDRILWEAPRASGVPAEKVKALAEELTRVVLETIDGAPWAPFEGVFGRGEPQGYFADVSETFGALALAYPLLDPAAQGKVKAFLSAERARHDPLAASYEKGQGRRRESFAPGPRMAKSVQFQRAAPGERFYRLWEYHYYTGTPVDAETWRRYARAASAIRAGQGTPFWYASENTRLASLIGVARLAAMAGDEKAVEVLSGQARQAMRDRLTFEQENRPVDRPGSWHGTNDRGGLLVVRRGNNHAWIPRWRGLTPEIGRLLRTGAAADMARQDRYADITRPAGFVAWGPKQFEGEVDGNQPHQALSLFLAKACIQQRPGEELAIYADLPWCQADLYYIQKLAAAIRAFGRTEWVDMRAPR